MINSFIYHHVFIVFEIGSWNCFVLTGIFVSDFRPPCYLVGSQELVYVYFGAGFLHSHSGVIVRPVFLAEAMDHRESVEAYFDVRPPCR